MSTRTENPTVRPAVAGVKGARILIVESHYYPDIADALIAGAEREITKNGAKAERINVPGAFEIPGAIALAAAKKGRRYDGYIALGCVIRGETTHDQHINRAVSLALEQIGRSAQVPVLFGVLTCDTLEQAIHRSGGNVGNKGSECAAAGTLEFFQPCTADNECLSGICRGFCTRECDSFMDCHETDELYGDCVDFATPSITKRWQLTGSRSAASSPTICKRAGSPRA